MYCIVNTDQISANGVQKESNCLLGEVRDKHRAALAKQDNDAAQRVQQAAWAALGDARTAREQASAATAKAAAEVEAAEFACSHPK